MISDQLGAGLMLNMMDDPRHRRIRGLVNKGFTPHRIGALEPELRRRARAILDAVPAGGACDFVTDVARELPLQAICLLLGVPQQDRAMLCEWMDRGLEAESGEALNREYGRMLSAYGVELIRAKRTQPGDDLLSVVIQARMPEEDPPALGDDELMFFFSLLFTAGSETTRKAIAGGLRALVENPAELARLQREPGLLGLAVEEMVRWTTPCVYKRRTATCDLELHGEKIRAGDKVTFWEMSANRDERVFAEPFRFDVARDPNPHLGFGQGVHYCLGANLARLEMRVMFEELFARYDALRDHRPRGVHAREPAARPQAPAGAARALAEPRGQPGIGSVAGAAHSRTICDVRVVERRPLQAEAAHLHDVRRRTHAERDELAPQRGAERARLRLHLGLDHPAAGQGRHAAGWPPRRPWSGVSGAETTAARNTCRLLFRYRNALPPPWSSTYSVAASSVRALSTSVVDSQVSEPS